jgi:hypothetical protein
MNVFESSHQVDMKNVVKCWKDFFDYFDALETHSEWYIDTSTALYLFFTVVIESNENLLLTYLYPPSLSGYHSI